MSFAPDAAVLAVERDALDSADRALFDDLRAAHDERLALSRLTNCYRLSDATADALSEATVERYADYAVIQAWTEAAARDAERLSRVLLALGARGVYLKVRSRADPRKLRRNDVAPVEPILGQAAPSELQVSEHERRFWVRLADGMSTGLFFDQRDNRSRVQADCRDMRVLNLFCYTGSFSVAAGLGGAREVISVDSSKSALGRLDTNLKLNQLPAAQHRLLKADSGKWLARAVSRAERFDWIILDPPSFSSAGSSTFSVKKHYLELAKSCLSLLAPGARLLAVTNHRQTTRAAFAEWLQGAADQANRVLDQLEWLEPPIDCPLGANPDAATKSVLLRAR